MKHFRIALSTLLMIWLFPMDYGIAPRVMGHELELHPLLAIFTMMGRGSGSRNPGNLSFDPAGGSSANDLAEIRRRTGFSSDSPSALTPTNQF